MKEMNQYGQDLKQPQPSFKEPIVLTQEEEEASLVGITKEVNQSIKEDDLDNDFINDLNTFADDCLLEDKVKLAAFVDIDKETRMPYVRINTENGPDYQEWIIPMIARNVTDWDVLKKKIKNIMESWKRSQMEANPHDNSAEQHQTAA